MDNIAPEQARATLDAVDSAQRRVAEEVGLPRGYWWAMAAGWLVLGGVGQVGPLWLSVLVTVGFGAGHSVLATRLLAGRRRTDQLQVSAAVAGRRTPLIVFGILVAFLAVTLLAGLALDADGADHAGAWASVLVAAVIGFGGPEILRVLRRMVKV